MSDRNFLFIFNHQDNVTTIFRISLIRRFLLLLCNKLAKNSFRKASLKIKKRYPRVSYKMKQYRVLTCPKIWEQVFSSLLL